MSGIFSPGYLARLDQMYPKLGEHVREATGEKAFGAVLQAIEVVGVAGVVSFLNARHAGPGRKAYEVAGVPADLALGLLFTGFSVAGYFGQHDQHGQNVGYGLLSAYTCRMGTEWGEAAKGRAIASSPQPHVARGEMGQGSAPVSRQQQEYPWAA
jgi:hypothetical protein